MLESTQLVAATYNVGGARRSYASDSLVVRHVVQAVAPDILAVQEAVRYRDAEGVTKCTADSLRVGRLSEAFFAANLSLTKDFHPAKTHFAEARSRGYREWEQGLALLCRGFVDLSSPALPGTPIALPVFEPPAYEGNRDTEPRILLLARCDLPPLYPYVAVVHLTTLRGERAANSESLAPVERARMEARAQFAGEMRLEQTRTALSILNKQTDAASPVILMGDFNAESDEPSIREMLEHDGGFVHLEPSNPQPTHPKVASPIDHILVRPKSRVSSYECQVVDSDEARRASDTCRLSLASRSTEFTVQS